METQMWAIGLMVLISVLSAVGNLFIKLASSKLSFNLKTILTNFKLFVGLTIFAVTTVLALVAYSGGELSVLYPFMAFQYVWVNLLSVKFLGENIGLKKWLAIILIIIGISLVGLGS